MSLGKKIAFNTIIHTAGKFGASAIGVVIVGILARYLGVEGYGAYITVFAYLFFFAILSDAGLYVVTINEMNRSEYGVVRFFNNVFTIRFVSALFLMVVASVLVWVFPYSILIKIGVTIAAVSIFLNLINQVVVAFFQTKMNMKHVAVAEFVGKLLTLILTIWAIEADKGLFYILGSVVIGFGLNLIINLLYLTKFTKLEFAFEKVVWGKILNLSWPIALASVLSLIYFKADTLFLSLLHVNPVYATSNEEAVGIYGAPYKILEVLITWPAIFMGLVSPLLSNAWAAKKREYFRMIWQKAFGVIVMLILPMIVGGVMLARELMVFVAGPEFVRSAPVFQILIFAVAIIFITHLTTYSIIAIGRQKQIIKFYMIAAIGAVVGYVILIPKYSYFAAAWVTVVVEGFMLLATMLILVKNGLVSVGWISLFKVFGAAAIMGAVIGILNFLNILWLILIAIIVYFGILWFGGLLKKISLN